VEGKDESVGSVGVVVGGNADRVLARAAVDGNATDPGGDGVASASGRGALAGGKNGQVRGGVRFRGTAAGRGSESGCRGDEAGEEGGEVHHDGLVCVYQAEG